MRSVDFPIGWYWVRMPNGEWNKIHFSAQQMAWQFFRMPKGRFQSVAQQLGIDCWATPNADNDLLDTVGVPKTGR